MSSSFIEELNKVLKKRKLIKIRLLKSSIGKKDKNEVIGQIIKKTDSELVESIGNIAVLYKK